MAPDCEGPWILVTSAFHMPRALETFCAAGWRNLIPYPTDNHSGKIGDKIGGNLAENLDDLNTAVNEWIGDPACRSNGDLFSKKTALATVNMNERLRSRKMPVKH